MVPFQVPSIDCEETQIPYSDCTQEEKEKEGCGMKCTVDSAVDCTSITSVRCGAITYQECEEKAVPSCETKNVLVPFQTPIHQKKCLLDHDNPSIGKLLFGVASSSVLIT